MSLPVIEPSRVTVMIKPVGALCNLDCTYCYYLPTKTIYDGHEHKMSLGTLEEIFASVLPRFGQDVTIAWQGGEPTLAGLPFFRKAFEFQAQYKKPGQSIHHALQTNGTLLDDDWCKFLRENDFLIGLSVDGPPRLHDHYRLTNRGQGSSDQVLRGMQLLQKHGVEYNILCVLNDHNVKYPEEIISYLLNLGSRWLQFIPAIEWEKDPADPTRNVLAPYSPDPKAYGRFLCTVFDLWFEKYRKRVSVRIFDAVLNKLVLGVMPFCILDGSCHNQLTIEHDGAVFGCDHFVERRWQLARIGEPGWVNDIHLDGSQKASLTVHGSGYAKNSAHAGMDIHSTDDLERGYVVEAASARGKASLIQEENGGTQTAVAPALDGDWYDRIDAQRLGSFASRKQKLPAKCQACQWKPYCHGGCPKHRTYGGEVPEPTVLCDAYMMFYEHAMPRLQWLAGYLRRNEAPPDPQAVAAPAVPQAAAAPEPTGLHDVGRNDPCPCGSGLKYKKCHGRNR